MNRHLEDIPPFIRHLCVILFLVTFCGVGNWIKRNDWPYSKWPAPRPPAQVSHRPAPITPIAANEPSAKSRPTPNAPSPVQPVEDTASAPQ
jgi:hypothetical protein